MKRIFSLIVLAFLTLIIFAQNIPTDNTERTKLARQLTRSISLELGKVEGSMPQINILIKQGEKMQARTMVEDALRIIAKIEEDQQLLAQLDETADDEILMTAEVQDAKQYLMNKANQLRNAITIYILCNASLFGSEHTTFLKEIQGELSPFGVSFTKDQEQADWVIQITATAREYNAVTRGNYSNYFAYVDAQLSIDKKSTGKRVYENAFNIKGGHTRNYEQAAREAYSELTPQISTAIKEQMGIY